MPKMSWICSVIYDTMQVSDRHTHRLIANTGNKHTQGNKAVNLYGMLSDFIHSGIY